MAISKAYQDTHRAYQGGGQFAYQVLAILDRVTYTGRPPLVTASKNSPYLIGNPYRKTHNNGPHWP